MSYFDELNNVNVNEHVEQKNRLSYLSWAWAWQELKKRYPLSFYTIYEDARGLNYFTDGRTGYVKTGVTVVDGDMALEHVEYLPIMDYRNNSIPIAEITSFDVNKSIQRSLTKAVARHGLGLYIYAGEDLPDEERAAESAKKANTDDKAKEYAFALAKVIPEGSHKGETLKNLYKTARADVEKVYEENGDEVKKAIDLINQFIKESKK